MEVLKLKINNKAWFTLYEREFQTGNFLYHYTKIGNAAKILNNNSLKFSKISSANDPLEAKPKISKLDADTGYDFSTAIKLFKDINAEDIQLLCFTQDMDKQDDNVDTIVRFTDYSGRGFAFPRMWAQYANNNEGVCFVFDKKILTQLIQDNIGITLLHYGAVDYVSQFATTPLKAKTIENFLTVVNRYRSKLQKGVYYNNFFKCNSEFVEYNYFKKLDDWQGEKEYRFLAFGDEEYVIQDIDKALVGVIIGEKTNPTDEKIIRMFCDGMCELKKISFTYNGCKLTNL